MSEWALPLALLLGGLASGLHCAGMCGGIAAGFCLLQKQDVWQRQLAFNAGRITSYAAAGAAAGALGSAAAYAAAAAPAQTFLYFFGSAFAMLAGVHLVGVAFPLSKLERIGTPLWRRVRPIAARLLPARSLAQAYAAGLAWGWLPCGLVYGALAGAVFAGGPAQGALAMAAFGAGTLPWLLVAGVAAVRVRSWAGLRTLRRLGGILLIGLGGWGVAHASGLSQALYCF